MSSQIIIREAVSPRDVAFFWQQLHLYHSRDIFPDPHSEDRAYFLGEKYRAQIEALHVRKTAPVRYLLFQRDGSDIGLALTVIYAAEDGKQFILEFCVFPEFRGCGTGTACAQALLSWGRTGGAQYAELNVDAETRRRFWGRLGFVPNGCDEWGVPLMLLPPQQNIPCTVSVLRDAQTIWGLESSFLAEIGEDALDEEKRERLQKAIDEKQITFFVAKRLTRPVGMCSVSGCFSTFACRKSGVFDDFYIEPTFRHQGIARQLVAAAQAFCRKQGYASLTVGCAACDVPLYGALGFDTTLGTMLANNL